ncbi:MAG TPA: nuclear transport factor 2 family protein [Nitrososphaeraceae archaeon]|nr:nuclear transport factor 2 family protein [Nitrososphaeraceae archaeon]
MTAHVSKSGTNRRRRMKPITNEDIVHEYFRLIKAQDLYGLLDLFTNDAVIYEPFSRSENGKVGLQGKSAIEPFIKVAMMANAELREEIELEKPTIKGDNGINHITAYAIFERGEKVKAIFTFELSSDENYNSQKQKKIQSLHLQFVE